MSDTDACIKANEHKVTQRHSRAECPAEPGLFPCRHCGILPSPDEAEICEPCFDDRAPLWFAYHIEGGPDPTDMPLDVTVYEVGGSVRDGMLGIDSKDKDFAVEAPSWDRMKEFLEDRGFNIFVETPEFLTIRAHFPNTHPDFGKTTADFVLCRKDGAYSDSRHPDTVEPGTILDDLARRDFTVNAMARRLGGGELLDPFNGVQDLDHMQLRLVGGPARLTEDPLRALRALRFMVVKGFEATDELSHVLGFEVLASDLTSVSAERIREELHKMFKHDTPATLATLARFPHIMSAVFQHVWLKPTLEDR